MKTEIDEFKETVENKSKQFSSPINFFIELKKYNFTRIELMIIDSAIKKMPFDNLHNTLLLSQNKLTETIHNTTIKLKSIKNQ